MEGAYGGVALPAFLLRYREEKVAREPIRIVRYAKGTVSPSQFTMMLAMPSQVGHRAAVCYSASPCDFRGVCGANGPQSQLRDRISGERK